METRLSLEIFFQVTEDEVDGCYVAHAVGHDIVAQGETEAEAAGEGEGRGPPPLWRQPRPSAHRPPPLRAR